MRTGTPDGMAVYAGELDYLIAQIGGRPVAQLDYAQLTALAAGWIEHVQIRMAEMRDDGLLLGVAKDLARRRLSSLRSALGRPTRVKDAFVELFVLARYRARVLAYLSLQEGRDWNSAASEFPHLTLLVRQLLRRVGKTPALSLAFRVAGRRFWLNCDPLLDLRRLYQLVLRRDGRERSGWRALQCLALRLRFAFRARALVLALRVLTRRAFAASTPEQLHAAAHAPWMCNIVAFALLLLFPGAKTLPAEHLRSLVTELLGYLLPRIVVLRAVLPDASRNSHGVVKLLKVAMGVIATRLAARDKNETDEGRFILDTLRLAYCWGITYPLVDNVLDDQSGCVATRLGLLQGLSQLFSGEAVADASVAPPPLVAEVLARLTEVLELTEPGRREAVRHVLRLLLESHRADSQRRLSAAADSRLEDQVWTDSLLKAALIRIATLEVCGTPVAGAQLAAQMAAGLVNQLGDDLWDIAEDWTADHVTPFTLYLMHGQARNPFRFFVGYCLAITSQESHARRIAMAAAVLETGRCACEALPAQPDLAKRTIGEIGAALAAYGWNGDRATLADIPHVDSDAVIFSLEDLLLRPSIWR